MPHHQPNLATPNILYLIFVAPDVEPQLIPEQTHYQANRGEPFNAKVKVLGRPQCEVEWKRGSEAWFEYARYGGGFAQISIPAAQGTDSGEYTVTATNRAGSASATITVQIIGSYIRHYTKDIARL